MGHALVQRSISPFIAIHNNYLVDIEIPEEFAGEEVHLIWDNGSEALLYEQGVPRQAFYGGGGDDRRQEYLLTKQAKGNEKFLLFIEMACNGMFGNPADGGFLKPPTPEKVLPVIVSPHSFNSFINI